MLRKINFREYSKYPDIDQYFYEDYPIKPGYYFYCALVKANKVIPLKYLTGINIPDFFIEDEQKDPYWVYQGTYL